MRSLKLLLFSILVMILSWYLVNSRYQNYLPLPIFWVPVVCILSLIAYQIIELKEGSRQTLLILIEILIFFTILRTVFVPGVAFYGYDPYHEYATVIEISRNGWKMTMSDPLIQFVYQFPILHFLAIIYSQISAINLLEVVRWLPILFSFVPTLVLYLLARRIFSSERVGLLTAFGFSTLYQSLMFYSSFVREDIAFVMFAVVVYSSVAAYHSRKKSYLLLAFTASIVCVFAHQLTPFLLVAFVGLACFVENISGTISRFLPIERTYSTSKYASVILPLFLFMCLISYWFGLVNTPLQMIADMISKAELIGGGMPSIPSLRYLNMFWVEIGFALIFFLLSLYCVFLLDHRRVSLEITFLGWIVLMGVLIVGFTLGTVYPGGSFAVARRFETFGYPFLFAISGYVTHRALKESKTKRIGIILISIFLMFSFFQLYSIPPYLYSDYKIAYELGEDRNVLLPEEYQCILWFNGSGGVTVDWRIIGHALASFHNPRQFDAENFQGNLSNLKEYNYLIVHTIGISSLDNETLLKCQESTWINIVYDNEVATIYGIESGHQ